MEIDNLNDIDLTYGKIIIKDHKDILEELELTNEEDKILIESIINDLEKTVSEGILAYKTMHVPYIGRLAYDELHKFIKENKSVFSEISKTYKGKDFKIKIGEILRNKEKEIKEEDDRLKQLKLIKQSNIKRYNILYDIYGKVVADAYVYSLSLIKYIPYDDELQRMFDELTD